MGSTPSYDTDDNMTVYDLKEGKIIVSYSLGTDIEQEVVKSVDHEENPTQDKRSFVDVLL